MSMWLLAACLRLSSVAAQQHPFSVQLDSTDALTVSERVDAATKLHVSITVGGLFLPGGSIRAAFLPGFYDPETTDFHRSCEGVGGIPVVADARGTGAAPVAIVHTVHTSGIINVVVWYCGATRAAVRVTGTVAFGTLLPTSRAPRKTKKQPTGNAEMASCAIQLCLAVFTQLLSCARGSRVLVHIAGAFALISALCSLLEVAQLVLLRGVQRVPHFHGALPTARMRGLYIVGAGAVVAEAVRRAAQRSLMVTVWRWRRSDATPTTAKKKKKPKKQQQKLSKRCKDFSTLEMFTILVSIYLATFLLVPRLLSMGGARGAEKYPLAVTAFILTFVDIVIILHSRVLCVTSLKARALLTIAAVAWISASLDSLFYDRHHRAFSTTISVFFGVAVPIKLVYDAVRLEGRRTEGGGGASASTGGTVDEDIEAGVGLMKLGGDCKDDGDAEVIEWNAREEEEGSGGDTLSSDARLSPLDLNPTSSSELDDDEEEGEWIPI